MMTRVEGKPVGREKITVIGAGNVGGTTAQRLVETGRYDVVLLDIVDGIPQGKSLDLMQAAPLVGSNGRIEGTTDYKASAGSSLVVITSGVPRKPGMSREQLLETNAKIVRDVVKQAAAVSPNAILVVVTNPLDVMTYVAQKISKFPRERVVGMAGLVVGVAVKLGRHGVEEIVRLSLTKEEQAALAKSAASVKELCALVDRYL